ncbi:hypothetical protein WME89_33670 [Sorangium sp. So ce321]|uniref:hypothetical protein n=1 Tax=Sorangium sp. So ce321 TaxID=3133300 RepID=UPI003F5E4CB3
MKELATTTWEQTVRTAPKGPELLARLKTRLIHPDMEGPALDERRGEGPERIFERIAIQDADFRQRLEQTIDEYFQSESSAPDSADTQTVILGFLDLIQLLGFKQPLSSLMAWMQRYEDGLNDNGKVDLAIAMLDAVAIAQQPGLTYMRNFWLRFWTSGPKALRPSAFIGLRLHDPWLAAEQIPALLELARKESESAGPMLEGLWLQPRGTDAIAEWIEKNAGRPEAHEARTELLRRLPKDEWEKLPRARPKRKLTSLASGGNQAWT